MKVEQTKLDRVFLIKPEIFEDHRGQYVPLYNRDAFHAAGIDVEFVEDDISVSRKHVLRGFHGNAETTKLVSCLHGSFYLVVVNCNRSSNHFGQWQSFNLSDRNRYHVLIPGGYGNAHLALTDQVIFHYKQSTSYAPQTQFTYRWDHDEFNVWWPIENPILSRRDQAGRFVD